MIKIKMTGVVFCGEEVGVAHKCTSCKQYVHLICGVPDKDSEEGYGQKLTCSHCLNCRIEGIFIFYYNYIILSF
jgi:hypothetical protein